MGRKTHKRHRTKEKTLLFSSMSCQTSMTWQLKRVEGTFLGEIHLAVLRLESFEEGANAVVKLPVLVRLSLESVLQYLYDNPKR